MNLSPHHTHTHTPFDSRHCSTNTFLELLQTALNFLHRIGRLPVTGGTAAQQKKKKDQFRRRGHHGYRAKPGSHRPPICMAFRRCCVQLFSTPSIIGFAEKIGDPLKIITPGWDVFQVRSLCSTAVCFLFVSAAAAVMQMGEFSPRGTSCK